MGGSGGRVDLGVWQVPRMLCAWDGELGLLRIVLMIRPVFWVEGVTLHVGATLFEDILTKIWVFLLTPESCIVLVCLLVRGTWVPKVVREWSEFGSKFRSELELELEGGPADFLMMVVSEDSISVGGFEPGAITRQGGEDEGFYPPFLRK